MESDMALPTEQDSEWEYEYDENETEDYYFTLDLTTYAPGAVEEKQFSKNGKRVPLSKTTKKQPQSSQVESPPQDVETSYSRSNGTDSYENTTQKPNTFQILDLHTARPYIKYNDHLFVCHWFTDLGTQIWISRPGVVDEPRHAGHVLDVIASSQTRLVGRPAGLKRKRTECEDEAAPEERQMPPDGDPTPAVTTSSPAKRRSLVIDQRLSDPHLKGQASFMERLSALRLKKGERDALRIPLQMPKYYHGAVNPAELREAARRKDAEAAGKEVDESLTAPPVGAAFAKRRKGGEVGWERTSNSLALGNNDGVIEDAATPGTPTQADSGAGMQAMAELEAARLEAKRVRYERISHRGGRRPGAPTRASLRAGLGLKPSLPEPKSHGRPRKATAWDEQVMRVEDMGEEEADGGVSEGIEESEEPAPAPDEETASGRLEIHEPDATKSGNAAAADSLQSFNYGSTMEATMTSSFQGPDNASQNIEDRGDDIELQDMVHEDDDPTEPSESIDNETQRPSSSLSTTSPHPNSHDPFIPLSKPHRRRRTPAEMAAAKRAKASNATSNNGAGPKPIHRRRTRTQMAEYRISEAVKAGRLEEAAKLHEAESERQKRLGAKVKEGYKKRSKERLRKRREARGKDPDGPEEDAESEDGGEDAEDEDRGSGWRETVETDFRGEVLEKKRVARRKKGEIQEEERRKEKAAERVVVPGQVGMEFSWRLDGWDGDGQRRAGSGGEAGAGGDPVQVPAGTAETMPVLEEGAGSTNRTQDQPADVAESSAIRGDAASVLPTGEQEPQPPS